jgi:hypothetical protein
MTNPEREVYEELYRRQQHGDFNGQYGHSNHGAVFMPHLLARKPKSVLDVGCGHNEFARELRDKHGIAAWGIDFACPGADQIADLCALPIANHNWEWVTAWDVMEHLLPEQVDKVLAECRRVGKYLACTIATFKSSNRLDGRDLHPTVRPREWWVAKLERDGEVEQIQLTDADQQPCWIYVVRWRPDAGANRAGGV